MTTRIMILFILAVIFAMLAILFLVNSSVDVKVSSSSVVNVANFQSSLYATGCAIISAILLVGAFIVGALDEISKR